MSCELTPAAVTFAKATHPQDVFEVNRHVLAQIRATLHAPVAWNVCVCVCAGAGAGAYSPYMSALHPAVACKSAHVDSRAAENQSLQNPRGFRPGNMRT